MKRFTVEEWLDYKTQVRKKQWLSLITIGLPMLLFIIEANIGFFGPSESDTATFFWLYKLLITVGPFLLAAVWMVFLGMMEVLIRKTMPTQEAG